jgi:hypothetical protein
MKRPKIKDMTSIERLRFRCLQSRRAVRRGLLDVEIAMKVPGLDPEQQAGLRETAAYFETGLMLTKPSWVAKATVDGLVSVLRHLRRDNSQ